MNLREKRGRLRKPSRVCLGAGWGGCEFGGFDSTVSSVGRAVEYITGRSSTATFLPQESQNPAQASNFLPQISQNKAFTGDEKPVDRVFERDMTREPGARMNDGRILIWQGLTECVHGKGRLA